LDRANGETLVDALLELHHERDMALVMVTHNPEIAEKFPRKIYLENGQIRRS
jgi:ABC-type lipoprotein export system ATPase subunit